MTIGNMIFTRDVASNTFLLFFHEIVPSNIIEWNCIDSSKRVDEVVVDQLEQLQNYSWTILTSA